MILVLPNKYRLDYARDSLQCIWILAILVITPFLLPEVVQAGLDKYSYMAKVEDWLIERKYDSLEEIILCRASIPKHGGWFGARIRLNKHDELIIPSELGKIEIPSDSKMKNVIKVLSNCRSGLFYKDDTIDD